MRMVVTGVPGVGKTSVMEGIAREKGIRIVNFGTVMLEIAKSEGLAEDRYLIRKLPVVVQRDIQEKAASRIYEMGEVIVDTHCTIKTPVGYYPGLPEWILRTLKPERIVLVEATPDEIVRRRTKDKSRKRDEEGKKEIEVHQMMNRCAAASYSMLSGASVKIVFNHDDYLNEAVKELLKVF